MPVLLKRPHNLSKKEWLLTPIELVSKALHKNKASIRIRLCAIIAEKTLITIKKAFSIFKSG